MKIPNPNPLQLLYYLFIFPASAYGFGSMGPISASFGDYPLFCAIDASGKQAVICWDANNSSSTALPPMASLSGGDGFLCGIMADNSQPLCWGFNKTSDLVPNSLKLNAYSHIASGKDHVCAIRGSYFSEDVSGNVDCWDIVRVSNTSLISKQSIRFYDQNASSLVFTRLVSGDGFSCGVVLDGGIACWGPNSSSLAVSAESENFVSLASNVDSICGVSQRSGEIKCWGNTGITPPSGIRLVALAAGAQHFCGIREDNHGIECWGSFNASLIPKGAGFLSIASSEWLNCGIREGDLVLDCWFANVSSQVNFDPPLQLCSPGLCRAGGCGEGMFGFNASLLNEPDLTSLCVRKDLNICSPCGFNCTQGFFPSSLCSSDADRVCTPCSLCQNSTCEDVCKLKSSPQSQSQSQSHGEQLRQLLLIIGSSASGFLLILIAWCLLPRVARDEQGKKTRQCLSCFGKPDLEADGSVDQHGDPATVAPCPGVAQVFRLSELKDATNGFKELKIAMQAAKGLEYLHKEAVPPIVHRDIRTSKILLDADWGARISDFGLLTPKEVDSEAEMKKDVYSFGVVLLEILSGRKAYDEECSPPSIVDWALPQIKQGRAAAAIDRYVALPRNVEPLLKLADIAELALREDPNQRASMSDLALLLDQLGKEGLVL
ncbi:hypothetical protein SASPL_108550 [Salvia splendens]|uniref:non-specific serine/threonine protein kinase n=1 Tax=Salvia splendens TaxID=180675 RepID=A0A8X9A7J9_SALSN|nr:hypothetical protein SASPL_108550 [Salvia splendens]